MSLSSVLETCDGRDKLSAFIQYSSKFYATCIYHAIDLENNNSSEESYNLNIVPMRVTMHSKMSKSRCQVVEKFSDF